MKTKAKFKEKALLLCFVLILVFTLSLTACGNDDEEVTEDGLVQFKLAAIGTDDTTVEPVLIGIEKGFFEEEGLEIVDVGDVAINQFVSSIQSGQIDAALLMTSDGVAAIDNGADLIEVAVSYDATEEKPHMTFVVAKDSPIKTGSDLVGKKFGVVGLGGCLIGPPLEFMAQDGVEDPYSKIEFVTSPENTLVQSVSDGDLDAAALHLHPAQVEALYGDQVRVLFTDYTVFGDRGGDIAWFVSRKFAEENPETVTKFVSAIGKVNNYINEDPEAAAAFYKENARGDINETLFHVPYFAPDAIIQESHTTVWLDVFKSGNSYQEFQHPDWEFEDVATNKYNLKYTG
ncbi:MAG: ABC transporter substrate-binding protein [Clostridiales Family XIII bacterium]|jgi:NitT/TauT family transport system substrate-binding protein|nr:ABC transporter substrate-binding protein [Clostridiales Family XIII bacterium]